VTRLEKLRARASGGFDLRKESDPSLLNTPLREARLPPDSRVAAIIRGDQVVIPRGDETIQTGDRIVVIGSPQAAQAWSALIMPGTSKVTDVVIFGAGQAGTAIARLLLEQGVGVRLIEASRDRARLVAAELPDARVYHATGLGIDSVGAPGAERFEPTLYGTVPARPVLPKGDPIWLRYSVVYVGVPFAESSSNADRVDWISAKGIHL